MKSNYKQLGKIVQWCDERNRNAETSEVLGVSIGKEYMPSVANIIGTDLSNYKLVRKNRFACNPMHVGRDKVLPIALYPKESPAIVSPAYFTFEVINTDEVLPEYLMLLFSTPVFDRNCWFRTDGTVRGGISWDDLCRVELPVPDIEKQKTIVRQINQCSICISNKTELIAFYEESLQTLYKSYNFNSPNISECWETCTIGDLCQTIGGGTPSTDEPDYYEGGQIPWVTPTDVTRNRCLALLTPKGRITDLGLAHSSAKMVPPNTILMTSRASVGFFAMCEQDVCTNQGFISCIPNLPELRMFLLCNLIDRVEEIRTLADGGATYSEISKKDFRSMEVSLPPTSLLKDFESKAYTIFSLIRIIRREIESLKELRAVILSTL